MRQRKHGTEDKGKEIPMDEDFHMKGKTSKAKKRSYIEALVTPEGFLILVYGDSSVNRELIGILSKYGLCAVNKFCSPCG
jgi:hypothetical protein